jgi:YggT family protein
MFILGNVLIGIGMVLWGFFWFYKWILFGRAIVSWVNADPRNGLVRVLVQATDPPLRLIRRMLPTNLRYFPIDVSFIVLLALVIFGEYAVAQSLLEAGARLKGPAYVAQPLS